MFFMFIYCDRDRIGKYRKVLVVLGIALLLIVSCELFENDDSENNEKDLVGTWYSSGTDVTVTVTSRVD